MRWLRFLTRNSERKKQNPQEDAVAGGQRSARPSIDSPTPLPPPLSFFVQALRPSMDAWPTSPKKVSTPLVGRLPRWSLSGGGGGASLTPSVPATTTPASSAAAAAADAPLSPRGAWLWGGGGGFGGLGGLGGGSHSSSSTAASGALQCYRSTTTLLDLPPRALCAVWARLSSADRRALRLASAGARAGFGGCVVSLQLSARDLAQPGQLKQMAAQFADLNALHLGADFDLRWLNHLRLAATAPKEAVSQTGAAAHRTTRLPHLHTFTLAARLNGEALLAVARFLVAHPRVRRLALPAQRAAAPADQKVLAIALEALPDLVSLDLGGVAAAAAGEEEEAAGNGGGSSSRRGGDGALSLAVLQRAVQLTGLRSLAISVTGVPNAELAGLSRLALLRDLSLSVASGMTASGLASGVARLTRLTRLELEHPSLGAELVGVVGGLRQLRVLSVGLCPRLSDGVVAEVATLRQLDSLAVPFALGPDHLRLLARLPCLGELLTRRALQFDPLGPAHGPLAGVTRLVAAQLDARGKQLAAYFPRLEEVALKRLDNDAAWALRCSGATLARLHAGDALALSDEGFAVLAALRRLRALDLHGCALVTDAGLKAAFAQVMPALEAVALGGAPLVTDAGLQQLTASCRRLSHAGLSGCRLLSDRTLTRLARCEKLREAQLRGCRGFTWDGVLALAAAPHVRSVAVAGCSGVRAGESAAKRARPASSCA